MKRRDFIAGLGGAAAWPLVARRTERIFRFGVLNAPVGDPRHHVGAGCAGGDHLLG
jgi:hypothetical protein